LTNRGDDRHGRVSNGARHNLFIELPQIFNAPAATRDNDQIDR